MLKTFTEECHESNGCALAEAVSWEFCFSYPPAETMKEHGMRTNDHLSLSLCIFEFK